MKQNKFLTKTTNKYEYCFSIDAAKRYLLTNARIYTHDFHLDKAHLLRQNGGMDHANATDLGMITPLITTGYLERPGMFDMIKGGANRIFADSHLWKWQAPVAEQPTYSLGDITNTDKPGQDGKV